MVYKKGHKHTKETIEKLSIGKIGDKNPAKRQEVRKKISKTLIKLYEEGKKQKINHGTFKKRHIPWNRELTKDMDKRLKCSEKRKLRMRKIMKGNHHGLGRKQTMKELIKRSASVQHIKVSEWKGFITPIRNKIWFSDDYKKWRKQVFERDNYICQECNKGGNQLQAHHIIPFFECLMKDDKDLIFDANNGLTLCRICHSRYNGINQHSEGYSEYQKNLRELAESITNNFHTINSRQL